MAASVTTSGQSPLESSSALSMAITGVGDPAVRAGAAEGGRGLGSRADSLAAGAAVAVGAGGVAIAGVTAADGGVASTGGAPGLDVAEGVGVFDVAGGSVGTGVSGASTTVIVPRISGCSLQ